jgi:glycosyltransferase involved in cell wall biosynthesis
LSRLNLDVVWFTKYVVPFGVAAPTITSVHDLAYYMPSLEAYALSDTLYMRAMIKSSCRRADRIVAVSENTRQDILRYLKVPEEKVAVIHEAADERYRVIDDTDAIERFKKSHNLPERFILFTGGISPRKNLVRLIAAFGAIARETPHKLVLTGGKGWRNKEVLEALSGRSDIMRLGFVPDEEMPLLYNAADLFCYPSLYEGFGLPLLEAQRSGCPVVASGTSSLREVGGEGVLYIDPLDVDDMAEKIRAALQDATLRSNLVKKGFQNEKRFSFARAAAELLALMRQVARGVRGSG